MINALVTAASIQVEKPKKKADVSSLVTSKGVDVKPIAEEEKEDLSRVSLSQTEVFT